MSGSGSFLGENQSAAYSPNHADNTYADVGLRMESHLFFFRNPFLVLIRQERN
jgi:hypothetical protein